QYFGTAVTFVIFGDSDYTSRLFPAIFGIALVGLPFLLRRQLGTLGAFVAAGLLAVSPALLYFSRFARNDIYVAFFALAMVICMWRYLAERKEGWLIGIAPLLALSFAAKEVTFIIVGVFLVYLDIMLTIDLVQRIRSSREMTLLQTAAAYLVVTPTAWLIAASWPVTEGWRKTFNLTEMPAIGPVLLIVGTLAAPQFAPAIQSFGVDNQGYMGEDDWMRWSVLLLILGGAYVGVLWNWRVWLIAGALFYGIYVLLFTSFFTNMSGFWTGIWGSMDYWLEQQGVRRGDQPDYYYLILLPIYEFLPLVFALGGALYYGFRGKLEQKLLAASALLLVLTFSVLPDSAPLVGGFRIHLAFVIAIGAVVVLSMDAFTKFLLFWLLSILFGLTVAGEKMPWLTVHLALPLALLGAKIVDDILTSVRSEAETEGQTQGKEPSLLAGFLSQPMARFALGAALAVVAAVIFQAVGPASGISAVAWLLAIATAGLVVWVARSMSWRAAGQVAAVALFG
ncbi:MAG: glycosyltransferase family 39 protein, partial [Dehalococcoidia bacterium]